MVTQMDFLARSGTLKSFVIPNEDEDAEVATQYTQELVGNGGGGNNTQPFEDEIVQLREMMVEKDKVIDMLSKEKNYYVKKCEQHNKQLQNEIEVTRIRVEQQTQMSLE